MAHVVINLNRRAKEVVQELKVKMNARPNVSFPYTDEEIVQLYMEYAINNLIVEKATDIMNIINIDSERV